MMMLKWICNYVIMYNLVCRREKFKKNFIETNAIFGKNFILHIYILMHIFVLLLRFLSCKILLVGKKWFKFLDETTNDGKNPTSG